MKVLLDHNVHRKLKATVVGHDVQTTKERGWQELQNGVLLAGAALEFDVLITVDKNMPHQTHVAKLDIAVIILDVPRLVFANLLPCVPRLLELLPTVRPGQVYWVKPPADSPIDTPQ